ncbi:MAG: hypothetical protein JWL71_1010, partial [Acidobacteria bacterium]|nr:hypothetical protein [Acidobacteriota bacterium]
RIGAAPTLYEVQVGSALGEADVASITTPDLASAISAVSPGNYWVRVRSASGGAVGAWSSAVQIPLDSTSCSTAPDVPTLLPVTTTSGLVTFVWLAGGGGATSYRVQLSFGAGLAPFGAFTTAGAGTSVVWGATTGAFAARLVAVNDCGASAVSNEVAFAIQP